MESVAEVTAKRAVVAAPRHEKKTDARLPVLDGWRALSILIVLACHMLPLGPKAWQLYVSAGMLGMSLFFTLSGFLITSTLHAHRDIGDFFIRRGFRILPLAFVYFVAVLAIWGSGSAGQWAAHYAFLITYLPEHIIPFTAHIWSLCVEVHFYVLIGLLMAVTRFRGFVVLPLLLVAVTVNKFLFDPHGTSLTHFRIDEILSGCCLALIYLDVFGPRPRRFVAALPFPLLVVFLLATCHPALYPLDFFRSYAASLLIGHTLLRAESGRFDWLKHRWLKYVAEISFALYVLHPLTTESWLGSGDRFEKYLKRPLSIALSFAGAHLSTFTLEKRFIHLGKALVRWRHSRRALRGQVAPAEVG